MANRFSRLAAESVSALKRCGVLLLALAFVMLSFLFAAFAADRDAYPVNMIDSNSRGTLNIAIEDLDGRPVSGGMIQMYCVAQITETKSSRSLALTSAFYGWGGSTDRLSSDDKCAESLVSYVNLNHTPVTSSAEINRGSVVFENLAPGAYLIMQREASPGYGMMSPFLAFLPQSSDEGLVYDVDAQPKPVTRILPGSVEVTVLKEVIELSGKAPTNSLFMFMLTAETADAPIPKGGSNAYRSGANSVTVSRIGPGIVDFGLLSFTAEDVGSVFVYSVKEIKGTLTDYIYDTSVYTMTLRVSEEDDNTFSVTTTFTDAHGKTVSAPVFRNRYSTTDTTEPSTGGITNPNESTSTTRPGGTTTTTRPGGITTTTRPGGITTTTRPGGNTTTTRPGERYTTRPGEQYTTTTYRYSDGGKDAPPKLPQTGQLWWPVFVMTPTGVLLLLLGVLHVLRGKAEEAEDAA